MNRLVNRRHVNPATRDGRLVIVQCLIVVFLTIMPVSSVVVYADAESFGEEVYFNISRQSADLALIEFAEQANVTFVFPFDEIRQYVTSEVVGYFTRTEGLKILLEGAGLKGSISTDGVLTITSMDTYEIVNRGEEMQDNQNVISRLMAVLFAVGSGLQMSEPVAQTGASALEEIIVTAQRREQSLQDVPISMNVFTGESLERQGFEKLAELTVYSPGLIVRDRGEEQGVFLRGAGTQGKNRSIEQAVPTFIDGIHFGQAASVKNHFLDLERIEVLKGPQPVYFGQNAAAGALSITTRKPGPEWEGSLGAEFGSFGSQELTAAFGGPITETLGIRVAGRWDKMEGYLRDYVTDRRFPQQETKVGRVILQWTPNDRFQATATLMASDDDLGARPVPIVLDGFIPGTTATGGRGGEHLYIEGLSDVMNIRPIGEVLEVSEFSDIGTAGVAPFLSPSLFPDSVLNSASPSNNRRGVLDLTQCTDLSAPGYSYNEKFESCDFSSDGGAKPWYAALELNYDFGDSVGGFLNGAQLNSSTAFVHSTWWGVFSNINGGPIVTNPSYKEEELSQWSSELRLTSESGGNIEWMTGLYYQNNNFETSSNSFRADASSAIRGGVGHVTSEWLSGFAAFTFNFPQFDNKFALDVGARYTRAKKEGSGFNTPAEWIVEHPVTGLPHTIPHGTTIRNTIFDRAVVIGRTPTIFNTSQFSPGASFSAIRAARQELRIEKETSFDPQIVLHYRPSDRTSIYAKFVTGYKAGSFDTGVTEISQNDEDFFVGSEDYISYEIGTKGTYLDGRVRTDLAIYQMDISDLQITNVNPILDRSLTQNVGELRSKGIDFGVDVAFTESLSVSLNGSLMDSKFLLYDNAVCTRDEIELGVCDSSGLIDRSGSQAANAPDWSFSLMADYEFPVLFGKYRSNINAAFMASDEYIDNRNLQPTVMFLAHEDLGISFEIADLEDNWSIVFWTRNLMNVRPTHRPEFDPVGGGIVSNSDGAQLATENFNSFGLTMKYNFF